MSATAVLNLIAPSAPLPVQAAGDADASIFGGLLSDVGAGNGGADDSIPPQPTTQPPRDTTRTTNKLIALDGSTPSTLIDPTGLGTIQTQPPAPADETVGTKATDVALTFPGPAVEADSSASDVAAKPDDQPPVMPLPIVPMPVAATASTAALTPTVPVVLPDVTAADATEAALLAAAAEATTDDAQTLPPAATDKTAATTPPVPQVQPPAPPPRWG